MLCRNRDPIKARVLPTVLSMIGMLGAASGAIAQEVAPEKKQPAEPKATELTVSPRFAPTPALRYRLLPLESERTPGDAAPIYLRLGSENGEEGRRQIRQEPASLLELPFVKFPVADARKLVDGWGGRLKQMEFGARRRTCNWNYTLPEQRERAFNIMLPDAQELRNWARLLSVKARVAIAEHKDEDAIRTLETGLAFSRHLADGPFLINQMVGIASAHLMLDRVEELVVQPDAPNLYWALTSLPRPLIDVRHAVETEQKMGDWELPEISEPDHPRTEAEWASLLVRLHARMTSLEKALATNFTIDPGGPKIADLAAFKVAVLPEARTYTKERRVSIEGLSDDQIILVFIAGRYSELRDEHFKPSYLPFPEALPLYVGADDKLKAISKGPLSVLASLMSKFVMSSHTASVRLDRRVAALRVIEALRLHLAANPGPLPGALDLIAIVPIPSDPVTGRPFEYRLEGETAVLVGPKISPWPADQHGTTFFPPSPGLTYRITLRK